MLNPWQPVELKGNRLQKRLAGSYFAAFLANRITIRLQNPQNLSSPSHFLAAILQVRQAASVRFRTDLLPRAWDYSRWVIKRVGYPRKMIVKS
jgi:hypothetical protein